MTILLSPVSVHNQKQKSYHVDQMRRMMRVDHEKVDRKKRESLELYVQQSSPFSNGLTGKDHARQCMISSKLVAEPVEDTFEGNEHQPEQNESECEAYNTRNISGFFKSWRESTSFVPTTNYQLKELGYVDAINIYAPFKPVDNSVNVNVSKEESHEHSMQNSINKQVAESSPCYTHIGDKVVAEECIAQEEQCSENADNNDLVFNPVLRRTPMKDRLRNSKRRASIAGTFSQSKLSATMLLLAIAVLYEASNREVYTILKRMHSHLQNILLPLSITITGIFSTTFDNFQVVIILLLAVLFSLLLASWQYGKQNYIQEDIIKKIVQIAKTELLQMKAFNIQGYTECPVDILRNTVIDNLGIEYDGNVSDMEEIWALAYDELYRDRNVIVRSRSKLMTMEWR